MLPHEQGDLFTLARERIPADDVSDYDRLVNESLDFGNLFSKSETELADVNRALGEYLLFAMGQSARAADTGRKHDNGGWMVQAMYLSMGKRHDYRDALQRVKAPTLVIHGRNDDMILHGSQMYVDLLSNSQLKLLADATLERRAGHFVFDDEPEQFAEAVGEFLRE